MTTPDPRALRDAFGSFPTGVTVVTARGADGAPHGFTANSFASVSLDPPLLLVCPGRFLSSFDVFAACGHFAVSVLAEGQEDVSNTFARYRGDRFAAVGWTDDDHGVPVIDGAAAAFSCRTKSVIDAGDHVILLGAVADFRSSGARGLGYAAGQYFSLGLEREAAAAPQTGRTAIAGAIIEHDGAILLEETPDGLRPPQLGLDGRTRVREALTRYLRAAGLDITLGKAYSLFDDRRAGAHHTVFRARAMTGATGGLGTFVPIGALRTRRFASDAHAAMLTRYALEYETRTFALYVGDELGGDIHALDQDH